MLLSILISLFFRYWHFVIFVMSNVCAVVNFSHFSDSNRLTFLPGFHVYSGFSGPLNVNDVGNRSENEPVVGQQN